MQSKVLLNPIYQHSGETEKLDVLAQQASINEDQELRRRQLDKNGEKQKKLVANEVAHMVDQFGGNVHLKATPFEERKQDSLLTQATHAASGVSKSVTNTVSNTAASVSNATTSAVNSASSAASTAAHAASSAASSAASTAANVASSAASTAANAASSAASTAANAASSAASTAVNAASSAANVASSAASTAANVASSAASTAAHAATSAASTANSFFHSFTSTVASLSHTAVDTATHAVQGASHKAADLAYLAKEKTIDAVHAVEDKAFAVAENISHFTALVGVIAEEENERARRMVSGDEARAAANAFRVSSLIRELDPCFYKQQPNLHYATKVLEEAERRWRLNSANSQVAETNAHKEGKLVSSNLQSFMPRYQWVRNNINSLEEKERTRRLNDSSEAWAMINAFATSWLIKQLEALYRQEGTFGKTHACYATTLLEENERRSRIRLDKFHSQHAADPAHHLMDVVNHNIEKFNYSTRHATRFASEFANLVGSATAKAATQFGEMTKDLANNATAKVQSVASDLSNFSNLMYVIALEERERARRISDPAELSAINNAWNQSQLIRSLPYYSLYKSSSGARYPLGMIEETERAWRIASLKPNASHFQAGLVNANVAKFQLASNSAAEREHAKDTAVHSRLNPNAPTFVPHLGLVKQAEPIVQPSYKASAAQL